MVTHPEEWREFTAWVEGGRGYLHAQLFLYAPDYTRRFCDEEN